VWYSLLLDIGVVNGNIIVIALLDSAIQIGAKPNLKRYALGWFPWSSHGMTNKEGHGMTNEIQ
jgi:hypothetical protein